MFFRVVQQEQGLATAVPLVTTHLIHVGHVPMLSLTKGLMKESIEINCESERKANRHQVSSCKSGIELKKKKRKAFPASFSVLCIVGFL